MTTQLDSDRATFVQLYVEVQQFYARHMQLLDSGATEAWADTFTEGAELRLPTLPAPVLGRQTLAADMDRAFRARTEAGEVQRHWHGMVDVDPQPDGSIAVRCYALVISSTQQGGSNLFRACVCEDRLVREDGRLRVRTRRVSRDDLP